MKIYKIVVQNINSLSSLKPIEIDFRLGSFREAGLFLITGETGSGKSTLLDAITLALYNRVPRLKTGVLADIVNSGSSSALAIVEFEESGEIYEASWSIRVLGKRGSRLKTPKETVRLKNLSSGVILAEKKKEMLSSIEKIINLNYKQFLRAVLLAQGEFSAFLSASPKDKSTLLEQMTGEDIYKKIGLKLRDKISSQNRVVSSLEAKVNIEDILTQDRKDELEAQLKDIEIELEYINRAKLEIDSLKSKKIAKEIELKHCNSSIQDIRGRLKSIDYTLRDLNEKELLDRKSEKLREITRVDKELKEIDNTLSKFDIDMLNSRYIAVEDTIDRYHNYKNSLLERDRLTKSLDTVNRELNTLTANFETKRDKKSKLEETLAHKEEIYRLQLRISSLKKERERLEEGRECILCGSTSHPKVEEYKRVEPTLLEREINSLKIEIGDLNQNLDSLGRRVIEYKRDREHLEKDILKIESSLEYIDIDIDEYQTLKDDIEREIFRYKKLKDDENRLYRERVYLDGEITKIGRGLDLILAQKELDSLIVKKETIQNGISELNEKIFFKDEYKLSSRIKELIKNRGSIEERFKQDRVLRERNQNILKEIEKERERVSNLNILLKLLGGTIDSFNIYVQRLTLIELINLANIHLHKFAPRYELRIYDYKNEKEALRFGLVDHYQANILREIDTSSGGEKFIISLALALGLSDLASKSIKIESLFIDEGFGTLDSRSLDTVITTLESLKTKDKLIGIISHVDSLKERIPTQIKIIKKGNGVSEVNII